MRAFCEKTNKRVEWMLQHDLFSDRIIYVCKWCNIADNEEKFSKYHRLQTVSILRGNNEG